MLAISVWNHECNCMYTDPFPPPENLQLIDMKPGQLAFSWIPTAHALLCSLLTYDIQSDCGECPAATSSTSVICTFESAHHRPCTFAVRSVVCGDIVGSWSHEIEAMLRGTSLILNLQAVNHNVLLLML